MEKLSIEQKAERYDKALKVIKDNLDALAETGAETVNIRSIENCFYRAFPELKESKESGDEKIGDEIIAFVEQAIHRGGGTLIPEEQEAKWVAWLENQGKHQKFIDAIQIGDKVTRNRNGALVNLSQLKRVAKPSGPKFHEGDWVVFNNRPEGSLYQVEKIENYEYTLRHFLGGSIPLSFSHENMIRLWTNEDALDGDLLASKYTVFIYSGSTKGYAKCYIALTKHGEFNFEGGIWAVKNKIHPATKEERDIFFTKLKEAGYEWDAKKRELKKIEQKPIELGGNEGKQKQDVSIQINQSEYTYDMGGDGCYLKNPVQDSTWSDGDKKMLDFAIRSVGLCKQYAINHQVNGNSKLPDVPKRYEELLTWLKNFKDRVQPKQEWGEDDKTYLDHVFTAIKAYYSDDKGKENPWREELLTWLKNLKERLKPQLKQEWSKEDEEMLRRCIIATFVHGYLKESDWLKFFKGRVQPQPEQEWNEEDERLFQIVIDILDRENHSGKLSLIDLTSCVKKLKSLRPQKQWKPSESQLLSLKIASDRNDRVGFHLTQLYEELKKLGGK